MAWTSGVLGLFEDVEDLESILPKLHYAREEE